MNGDHDWPRELTPPHGVAPGEMRLIEKVLGRPFDSLVGADTAQSMSFCQLHRLFPDDDPAVLWEHAEWIPIVGEVEPLDPKDANG